MASSPEAQGSATPLEAELLSLVRANYSIIYVATHEEQRALASIRQCAAETESYVWTWSVARGLLDDAGKPVAQKTQEPVVMLQAVMNAPPSGIFVLQDFHHFLRVGHGGAPSAQQIVGLRVLRDMAHDFRTASKTLVITAPVVEIPVDLEKDVHLLELPLPTRENLRELAQNTIEQAIRSEQLSAEPDSAVVEQLPRALAGLTMGEAENALVKTILAHHGLGENAISDIVREKEQVIRKSGTLEFYSSPEDFGSIGGLDLLKRWLQERAHAFSDRAREFGLPEPTGLLLVGVPGCGKSLCAKAVAQEWRMPLLRFDLGRVFARYVGEAEENMRRALSVAESVSPAVLWMDEIEKGLAGAGGDADSGVTARVFGTLLTWMQEKKTPVFVVATANDVGNLPPELLRRFDDMFFVDLPQLIDRIEILSIHLLKRNRDPAGFDLRRLAESTDGFSGAEIEQIVVDAMYAAFDAGEQLDDDHILAAARATRPLSTVRRAQIEELRSWAADRCRQASERQQEEPPEVIPPGTRFDRAGGRSSPPTDVPMP